VLNDSLELDRTFAALADPIRRGMLVRLSEGPASVSELAAPLPISLPAVLQHLKALEASGLVASEKRGRVRTVRVRPETLGAAEIWLTRRRREWEAHIDRFEDYLLSLKQDGGS
jgi:DNA-binding transcriptional ArsR family regulator